MTYKVIKTEHSGPKKGSGAYWGRKFLAKKLSRKKRRAISKSVSHGLQAEDGYYPGIKFLGESAFFD